VCYNDFILDYHALYASAPSLFRDERQAKLRTKQLEVHYFEHLSIDPRDMSDIGKLAPELCEVAFPQVLEPLKQQIGDEGKTIKTLFRLQDSNLIESVLMLYPDRATLCISSQVGCAIGCPFCATGKLGFKRNLSSREIIEQVFFAARSLTSPAKFGPNTSDVHTLYEPRRLTNIVFMGEGEPTQNLDNIFEALEQICAPSINHTDDSTTTVRTQTARPNFGIPARNVTISTSGIIPGINRLAEAKFPLRLAISLHAPTDELRSKLVPINKKYDLDTVLDAAFQYYQTKKRRVSIEYALMLNVNDSEKHANTLAKILNRRGSNWVHVNLIPLNNVEGSPWTASTDSATSTFLETLRSRGIQTTLRESRGQDIDGACGQLAALSDS
jgi:23S rRNA (adenine2503-C2)-methyltransferase